MQPSDRSPLDRSNSDHSVMGRSPHHSSRNGKAADAAFGTRPLRYGETYRCPVCRHGHLSDLTLMDAFACDFCRHIFTANLTHQTLQVADSAQPMSWRWTGTGWRMANHRDVDLTVLLWVMGLILLVVPAGIVGLAAYLFPPLPASPGEWLPSAWVAITFGIHLLMVVWLLVEHYQLPFYIMARIRLQRLFSRS